MLGVGRGASMGPNWSIDTFPSATARAHYYGPTHGACRLTGARSSATEGCLIGEGIAL